MFLLINLFSINNLYRWILKNKKAMEADKNTSNAVSSTRPLNIVCPDCEEENTLEYGNHIKCHKCENSFAGHTYQRFKKPFFTAKFALFIGAVGAYKLDKELLEPSRYSTGAIVEIVSFCSDPGIFTDFVQILTGFCVDSGIFTNFVRIVVFFTDFLKTLIFLRILLKT